MNEIINVDFNDKKGSFSITVDGKTEAKMTFVFAGNDKLIIDHTEVNPGNNGKGYEKKMVERAVAFALERNMKIIPLCPYAKSVFDRNPELRSVL
ncbi:GNAT family N-acetyltransferase [Flavobacterium undicola]|uniref:GNAT family N-acetyltransferase n=1 Tax=Flavobacterium undicola TaxID=1932779 RepID=UPI001376DA59|nr:GNAT family N-acetyltransferase [Flavobacterium undicola]MBA0882921.1 N-acetyltransferase [Flavobacterium undicola]